jgi:DNA-binding CsgD family transcriptional regulator
MRPAAYHRRMNTVSLRDVRALLTVAGTSQYDSRRGSFTAEGLTALLELLDADWVTYCERVPTETCATVKCEVETRPFAGHNAELEAIFHSHHHEFALGRTPGAAGGVILIGDVASDRAWRATGFYNEWCREVHIEPQAAIVLSTPGSRVKRRLMIDLADDAERSFGARERTLLTLIHPALLRQIAFAEAAQERERALGLTPREREILDRVRDGLTNGEIASQLFVSPSTIRSHLENAFRKLGAHTRTEAIARVAEIAGPPPRPHPFSA